MGQEISAGRFRKHDFKRFAQHLRKETALLGRWFREGSLSREHAWGGFELEAWLMDDAAQPAPLNDAFLAAMDDALVSPKLSRFNVELNQYPAADSGQCAGPHAAGTGAELGSLPEGGTYPRRGSADDRHFADRAGRNADPGQYVADAALPGTQ